MPAPTDLLEGTIEIVHVMFYDAENRYAIVKAYNPEKQQPGQPRKEFTFKGVLDIPKKGTHFKVSGHMDFDKGRQEKYFKIKTSEPLDVRSEDGWIEFLQHEGPGIGDVRARQLVETLGVDVIRVLAHNPEKAAKIPGLTPGRLKELSEWAHSELAFANIKQRLYKGGITQGVIRKIIIKYGHKALEVIEKDPFATTDIEGIGFVTANKIAEMMGCSVYDPRRIRCGIMYMLQQHCDQGHVMMVWDRLVEDCQNFLTVGRQAIIDIMKDMIEKGELCTNHSPPARHAKNRELFQPVSQ